MAEFENLLPKELKKKIKELEEMLNKKENSKNVINDVVSNERKNICCPCCGSTNIVKDGLYKGRQKYQCKNCNKKFNSLTNTPFHHTRLT